MRHGATGVLVNLFSVFLSYIERREQGDECALNVRAYISLDF